MCLLHLGTVRPRQCPRVRTTHAEGLLSAVFLTTLISQNTLPHVNEKLYFVNVLCK